MNLCDDVFLVEKYGRCPGHGICKRRPGNKTCNEVNPIPPDRRHPRQPRSHQAPEDDHIDQDIDKRIDERPDKAES